MPDWIDYERHRLLAEAEARDAHELGMRARLNEQLAREAAQQRTRSRLFAALIAGLIMAIAVLAFEHLAPRAAALVIEAQEREFY